jgi:NADPH:quinone reductase-like Zn-dependent oxidoreductase
MKALLFQFGGGYSVVDVPTPEPADDEVLVKVVNSAIDTAHETVVNKVGVTAGVLHKVKDPLYLGYHYSGIVSKVGSSVSNLATGSEVFGHLQYSGSTTQGAFAEYIVVKDTDCAIKPASVPFDIAAAAATETLTALQGMRDCGGLSEGKSVLIVGAAGGVGSAAVGIAKRLGAHVTAVCSDRDVQRVKNLGADVVINRSEQDITKLNEKFDVIFDPPNGLELPLDLLNQGGAYVITVPKLAFIWGKIATMFSSKNVAFVQVKSKREDLEQIAQWLQDGWTIDIDSKYDIKDMDKALESYKGHKSGRVVIQVDSGW